MLIIMNKQQLYQLVSDTKKYFNIKTSDYPINIFKLCDRISNVVIQTADFKTRDLRGMVCLASNKNENNVILVNSNKSFKEQNYHGTHELMHILTIKDAPGATLRCFEKVHPNQNSYFEWLANEGAAEFLMPYRELLPIIKDKSKGFDDYVLPIYDLTQILSDKYGVSERVAQNRINSLSYEIWQNLKGVDIEKIEIISRSEQQRRGIKIDSLIDIENRVLSDYFKEGESKPFFLYSDNYGFAV